jgi:hypothetical protein
MALYIIYVIRSLSSNKEETGSEEDSVHILQKNGMGYSKLNYIYSYFTDAFLTIFRISLDLHISSLEVKFHSSKLCHMACNT